MKKDGLLAEMISAVVHHNKEKIRTSKPNYYLNQKKQLWYGMMNVIDGADAEEQQQETPDSKR